MNNAGGRTSASQSNSFLAIQHDFAGFSPGGIVTPYLVASGTDDHHSEQITANLDCFLCFVYSNEDRDRNDGTNEPVGLDTLPRAMVFDSHLIVGVDMAGFQNNRLVRRGRVA